VRKKRLEEGGDDVARQRGPLVSEGEGKIRYHFGIE
jgi:hypothetical protein